MRDAASHLAGSDDADLLDIERHAARLTRCRSAKSSLHSQPGDVLPRSVALRHGTARGPRIARSLPAARWQPTRLAQSGLRSLHPGYFPIFASSSANSGMAL